ncbi:hypothetical protein [Streptomyces sp. NPDC090798]|uniref:hypothetical protein n=1 Tax=Streptomyces sp. NPDC090798 TaxID=3365968 RepID=UPI0038297654
MSQSLFIGGAWQSAASGAEFDTVDPATGAPHARCADADRPDVDEAVAAARAARLPRLGGPRAGRTGSHPVARG